MSLTPEQKRLVDQLDRDPFQEFASRDRYGRPEIDGKSYRRPSSSPKALEDKSNLIDWKSREAVLGAVQSPFLLDQVRCLDPDAPGFKREVDALVEQLADAAGASDARMMGSLIHAVLEVDDCNEVGQEFRWPYDEELFERVAGDGVIREIRRNYAEMKKQLGIQPVKHLIEVPLIAEELGFAGTCDRIMQFPGWSATYDLKTYEGRLYPDKFMSYIMQLHVYASATTLYDPETQEREDLPEDFDRDLGYICAIDRATGEVGLHEIDLSKQGPYLLELSERVLEARKVAVRESRKVTKKFLPRALETERERLGGRLAILAMAEDTSTMFELQADFEAHGLPGWDELTEEQVPAALALTERALAQASIDIPVSVEDLEKRLGELPEDLYLGAQAYGKFLNRWIDTKHPTESERIQAGIEVKVAEEAFEQRKGIMQAAAARVAKLYPEALKDFSGLLGSYKLPLAQPELWHKRVVRSVDALATAMCEGEFVITSEKLEVEDELGRVTERIVYKAEFVDAAESLKRIKEKLGKEKKPVVEAAKDAARMLDVSKERSFDAWMRRPEIVGFLLHQDWRTP